MFIWLHLCYAPVGHVTSLCSYFSCFPSLSFLSLYFFLLLKALCIRILLHFLTLPCMKFGKILWFSCFRIKSKIYGYYFRHGIFLSLAFTVLHYIVVVYSFVLIVYFVEAMYGKLFNQILSPCLLICRSSSPVISLSTCLFADLDIFILQKKQG